MSDLITLGLDDIAPAVSTLRGLTLVLDHGKGVGLDAALYWAGQVDSEVNVLLPTDTGLSSVIAWQANQPGDKIVRIACLVRPAQRTPHTRLAVLRTALDRADSGDVVVIDRAWHFLESREASGAIMNAARDGVRVVCVVAETYDAYLIERNVDFAASFESSDDPTMPFTFSDANRDESATVYLRRGSVV